MKFPEGGKNYLICETEFSKQRIKNNLFKYLSDKGVDVISLKRNSLFQFSLKYNDSFEKKKPRVKGYKNINFNYIVRYLKIIKLYIQTIYSLAKRSIYFLVFDLKNTLGLIYWSNRNLTLSSRLLEIKKEIKKFLIVNFYDLIELLTVIRIFVINDVDQIIVIDGLRPLRMINELKIKKICILRKELFKGFCTYDSKYGIKDFKSIFKNQNSTKFNRLIINKYNKIGFYGSFNLFDGIFYSFSKDLPFWVNYDLIIFDSKYRYEVYKKNTKLKNFSYSIRTFDDTRWPVNNSSEINKSQLDKVIIINTMKYYPEREKNAMKGYFQEIRDLAKELMYFANNNYRIEIAKHPKVNSTLSKDLVDLWHEVFSGISVNFYDSIKEVQLEKAMLFISQPSTTLWDCDQNAIKICLDIYGIDTCSEYSDLTDIYVRSSLGLRQLISKKIEDKK